ncbi:hypothetical protein [Nocardia seriolae]|uniref:Uncharacterized protein n=1 Tax=Nocardia seriolae TaxID=37332 RepID=A0A0B8N5G1_9NOCA|nr:hypothetical protein [Nocardia seriolae]APA94215.1 hypothetical protein NS506_00128 [Nocardia seriolae]MTJ60557.1 hypothetical protein [Nocardia seriolae]MTJ72212.1 hypothetical protein [Nocardia seriolae]MTJ84559.1 hypothetical protein [Nocardia seriolae]MTK28547.1 hypothetical protein [Nocardia seriolae]
MRWPTVFAEFVLVPVLVVAAVWCWRNGIQTTVFKPQGEAPTFGATRYVGPWLAGSAVFTIGAGLLFIDVVARAFSPSRGQRGRER